MTSKNRTFTFQTRLRISENECEIIDACAVHLNLVEHSLFADIASGKDPLQLKSSYQVKFGITGRQYNSCRVQLEGKIDAYKAGLNLRIADLQERIGSLENTLTKLARKKHSNRHTLHQKKRRLSSLRLKLSTWQNDREAGKIRLCFGSKKLFHAQFHLHVNGYASHQDWKKDWQQSRNKTFFLLGSKDESGGNQTCTATIQDDGNLKLRLRLPDILTPRYGKYAEFSNIHFHNGHKHIIAALRDCEERNRLLKLKDKHYVNHGQAISYRLHRDDKGWRLFASLHVPPSVPVSKPAIGAIGIDINADHLALSETDRFGNPVDHLTIPLVTYGKSKHQARALIGEACTCAVTWAQEKQKPIAIEILDFSQKKTNIKESSHPKYARMLSSFAYQAICSMIQARAYRHGIGIMQINPAYTSVIGRVKFAKNYGLSVHHAAAVCIARRSQGVSERLPRYLDKIPDGKGGHVALSRPVRKQGKHVWSQWSEIKKSLLAVLAAQTRASKRRSTSASEASCSDSFDSSFAGEIPARESSIQRLDWRV